MDSSEYGLFCKVLDCLQVCVVIMERAKSNDGARRATEHLVKDMTREAQELFEHLCEVIRRQSEAIKGS